MPADQLLNAYLLTDYGFRWQGSRAPLRIGLRSAMLAACLEQAEAKDAALITAWNPRSQLSDRMVNEARHGELAARVDRLKLTSISADGRDPSGLWPPEASLLIVGAGFARAAALAADFGQNAFVYSAEDATPRLVIGETMAAAAMENVGPVGRSS